MPKFEATGSGKKISLSQIIETGNVRENYEGIAELAATIKANGQLQPILVKPHGKNADGLDEYELVAGHRRIRAFRLLSSFGDDFSRIDAVVTSGDKLTLQLIENLQRSDLTPEEREHGVYEMTKDGKVSQRDVAAILGKNDQFIWRNIGAYRIRKLAEKAGVDTSGISTNTLCEIASAADGDIPLLIERLKEEGGTLEAARRLSREYRNKEEVPPEREPEIKPELDHQREAQYETEPQFNDDDELSDDDTPRNIDIKPVQHISELDTPRDDTLLGKPVPKQNRPLRETRTLADFDPPHKSVDINDVLVIIKNYIDRVDDMCTDPDRSIRIEAAWDIVALLHKEL